MMKVYSRRAGFMGIASKPVEIEYLESTGTQYIDLGAKATLSTTIEIDFLSTDTGMLRLFGARSAWNKNAFCLTYHETSDTRATFNYDNIGSSSDLVFDVYLDDGNWHTAKSNGSGHIQVDSISKKLSASSFRTPYNILLFAYNNNGTILCSKARIRRVKFNSLDLIPVRVGNVGYMYDKVSGKLFGNAGTGKFILGPDK
jgi:hypothetical protein